MAKYRTKFDYEWKNVYSGHAIQTRDCKMVGPDEFTDLWHTRGIFYVIECECYTYNMDHLIQCDPNKIAKVYKNCLK